MNVCAAIKSLVGGGGGMAHIAFLLVHLPAGCHIKFVKHCGPDFAGAFVGFLDKFKVSQNAKNNFRLNVFEIA